MRLLARLFVIAGLSALALPSGAMGAVQTLVFHSSPITVGPYSVGQNVQLVAHPDVDGYVVGIDADVVDEGGAIVPITQVMLHHVVFAKLGARDSTCGGNAERFYAAGEERNKLVLPAGMGYPNAASSQWAFLYMLMNHRNVGQTVRVQYTVRYVTGEQLVAVKPIWLDEHNCSTDPIFNIPGTGKRFSAFTKSTSFTMPESGRIVAGGGHLHGGALRLELRNTSCNRTLFTSEPTWGFPKLVPVMHEPGPLHMSAFTSAEGIPVARGERLQLDAVYDNSVPHVRVMGIMQLYFVPGPVSSCAAMPALAPDPLSHPSAPPRIVLPLLRKATGPVFKNAFTTWVGDYLFGRQRIELRRGSRFTWHFVGRQSHDVTLANGPVGFASPWSPGGSSYSFRFTHAGTYRLFCSLHPTLMTQVIVVH